MRCHLEDGPALHPATAQMIACNATITAMLHDANGNLLNVGRRTRKPPPALRRAARERDRHRCRFPGCESRRTGLHHIRFWSNGGHTKLANIICLCKRHHALVHDKGIIIATVTGGAFTFTRPDGTPIHASPHPAALRRTPQPAPGHLDLLRQRQGRRRPQEVSGSRSVTRPGFRPVYVPVFPLP